MIVPITCPNCKDAVCQAFKNAIAKDALQFEPDVNCERRAKLLAMGEAEKWKKKAKELEAELKTKEKEKWKAYDEGKEYGRLSRHIPDFDT